MAASVTRTGHSNCSSVRLASFPRRSCEELVPPEQGFQQTSEPIPRSGPPPTHVPRRSRSGTLKKRHAQQQPVPPISPTPTGSLGSIGLTDIEQTSRSTSRSTAVTRSHHGAATELQFSGLQQLLPALQHQRDVSEVRILQEARALICSLREQVQHKYTSPAARAKAHQYVKNKMATNRKNVITEPSTAAARHACAQTAAKRRERKFSSTDQNDGKSAG